MKKEETLVHIKFDREEAKEYKRSLLHAQLSLLKVTRALKSYKENRLKELEKKKTMYQELKEMRRRVKSLESALPKPKIPKMLKKEEVSEEKEIIEEKVLVSAKKEIPEQKIPHSQIELELLEIQRKLDSLR